MFMIVSHTPSDDLNCPGIDVGPLAATPADAIEAWKEHRLSTYEESGERDPDWSPDSPDSYEGMVIDLASDLHGKLSQPLPLYANGEDEQVYLVEVPELPATLTSHASISIGATKLSATRIESFANLSTAHISEEVASTLDDPTKQPSWKASLSILSREYGWFVRVPDPSVVTREDYAAIPTCLRACLDVARADGAVWVLFDRDEEATAGLPVFDW